MGKTEVEGRLHERSKLKQLLLLLLLNFHFHWTLLDSVLSQYFQVASEFSPSFLFITDLSEYWNSALFPTIVVISLLIVADIFVSVFYMGESARQRRRLYSLRNYYRRRNFGAPKTRHGHHHHHATGRMGYSEEAAENPDEYQRSE